MLAETVYCQQSPGFVDPTHSQHVCCRNKALYGLKQAPCAWYSRFQAFILSISFSGSKCDPSCSSTPITLRSPTCCYMSTI
uniref:Reverse transcriptase Ty1/copia-type domain-containing protein n=1 Tax=Arundo donax TaxID=35708 RepID=A0A0A9ASS4_ARUDO